MDNEQALEKKMREAVRFFETAELPDSMILSNSEVIINTKIFLHSHISTLRAYWANPILRQPYLERFMSAYELIKNKIYEQPAIKTPAKQDTRMPVAKPVRKSKRK